MEKKNLSRFYTRKVGVKQSIEEMQKPTPQILARPVSAGGLSPIPATLSQEYLMFVLGIDEVPPEFRGDNWALVTRMNNMTIVSDENDFERMTHGIRAMLRPMCWDRKITLRDMNNLEYYAGVQLRRSRGGRQLKYISPGYSQILHEESSTKDSVIDEKNAGNAAMGILNKQRGMGR